MAPELELLLPHQTMAPELELLLPHQTVAWTPLMHRTHQLYQHWYW